MTIKQFVKDNFDLTKEDIRGFSTLVLNPKTDVGRFLHDSREDIEEPLNLWFAHMAASPYVSMLNVGSLITFLSQFYNFNQTKIEIELKKLFWEYYSEEQVKRR
jgi:hypothetical protein